MTKQEGAYLKRKYVALLNKKKEAFATKEHLLEQLESQDDPLWVEMLLKKNLGLVPKGQVKVVFPNG